MEIDYKTNRANPRAYMYPAPEGGFDALIVDRSFENMASLKAILESCCNLF